MATISRFRAVAMIGPLRLTGLPAWMMWLVAHLFYITGFHNRLTAVLHWLVSFLGRGRSERTTTEQQVFARTALARLEQAREGSSGNGGRGGDRAAGDFPGAWVTAGAPAFRRARRSHGCECERRRARGGSASSELTAR
jgi:hypothetical protein